jgi:hypothetical protein
LIQGLPSGIIPAGAPKAGADTGSGSREVEAFNVPHAVGAFSGDEQKGAAGIEKFRSRVREQRLFLESYLDAASSMEHAGGRLRIIFPRKYFIQREKVMESENQDILKAACREVFGPDSRLSVELEGDVLQPEATAGNGSVSMEDTSGAQLERIRKEPVVRSFLETFPGKVTVEEE